MGVQPETRLVHQIVKAITDKYPDAWCLKVAGGPYQRSGVPDLLVCVNGRLVGLEAKCRRPGESGGHARGRATVIQMAEIGRMCTAGAIVGVVLSPEEALELVDLAAFQGVIGPELA